MLRGENTHRTFRIGDQVRVQVVRVDQSRRQVDLGLVAILERLRKDAGRGEGRRPAGKGPGRAEERAAGGKGKGARGKGGKDARAQKASRPGKRERAVRKAVKKRR